MKVRREWRVLGFVAAILVMVIAIAGLGAPLFAHHALPFDILANFRVHFLGLLAAGVLALILRRFWFTVLVSAMLATPVGIGAKPLLSRPGSVETVEVEGRVPVKVITLNTWHSNERVDEIADYLRAEGADVVVLMEVAEEKGPMLAALAGLYPYREDCIDVTYCHLVMLSKHPFEDSGWRMRWDGPPIVWARFGPGLAGLTVIGTHLSRIPKLDRQHTHVRELAREATERGNPIIVAGDFNATEWSLMIETFEGASGLKRTTNVPSWPTWFFGLPQIGIDHIFVSDGIVTLGQPRVGDDVGSDHLPVTATFGIAIEG